MTADGSDNPDWDIAESIIPNAGVKDGEILLDVPLKGRLDVGTGEAPVAETQAEAGRKQELFVQTQWPLSKQVRGWKPLVDYSPLVKRLGGIETQSGLKIRVFVAQSLIARLPPADVDLLEKTCGDYLATKTKDWPDKPNPSAPKSTKRI